VGCVVAGCGTGENALDVASLGLHVLGVDVAQTALSIAREKAARRGISQEELRAAFDTSAWSVASVSPDRLRTRFDAQGAPAWLARIERRDGN
jgi:predicted RNA methylase